MAKVRYQGTLIDEEDLKRLYPGARPDGGGGAGSMGSWKGIYSKMGDLPSNQPSMMDQYRMAAFGNLNTGVSPFSPLAGPKGTTYDTRGWTLAGGANRGNAAQGIADENKRYADLWRSGADNPNAKEGWFNQDNMSAFASGAKGLGSLASGWAALKNLKLSRQAMENQQNQWQTNFDAQALATNNAIANQNAWKKAQGRTDYGAYVGGKPAGSNYVG